MFQNMGVWDWFILLGLGLLLFGSKRLPELAKSLGRSVSALKQGMKEGEEEYRRFLEKPPPSDPPSQN